MLTHLSIFFLKVLESIMKCQFKPNVIEEAEEEAKFLSMHDRVYVWTFNLNIHPRDDAETYASYVFSLLNLQQWNEWRNRTDRLSYLINDH